MKGGWCPIWQVVPDHCLQPAAHSSPGGVQIFPMGKCQQPRDVPRTGAAIRSPLLAPRVCPCCPAVGTQAGAPLGGGLDGRTTKTPGSRSAARHHILSQQAALGKVGPCLLDPVFPAQSHSLGCHHRPGLSPLALAALGMVPATPGPCKASPCTWSRAATRVPAASQE